MGLLNVKTFTVYRDSAAGSFVDGDWVPAVSTSFTVQGNRQEVSGRELEALPEGIRSRVDAKLYTKAVLQTVQIGKTAHGEGQGPDQIEIGGERFEVTRTEDWTGFGGLTTEHRKYFLLGPQVGQDVT